MTQYWLWGNYQTSDDHARIHDPPLVFEKLDLDFGKGEHVEREVPPIKIIRSKDAQGVLLDNLLVPAVMGLAISAKLRGVLAEAGVTNVEYFACHIANPRERTTTDDYVLANVVGKIACVDRAKSDLVMHPRAQNQIQFINKLVLDEAAIGDVAMFRLAEFIPLVFVHQRVKDACEAAGITGVKFMIPADAPL